MLPHRNCCRNCRSLRAALARTPPLTSPIPPPLSRKIRLISELLSSASSNDIFSQGKKQKIAEGCVYGSSDGGSASSGNDEIIFETFYEKVRELRKEWEGEVDDDDQDDYNAIKDGEDMDRMIKREGAGSTKVRDRLGGGV